MAAQGCEFYLRVLKVSLTSERFFFFQQLYWVLLLLYTTQIYNTTHTHTHTKEKKEKEKRKKKQKPKRGRCKGTNVPCEASPLHQDLRSNKIK